MQYDKFKRVLIRQLDLTMDFIIHSPNIEKVVPREELEHILDHYGIWTPDIVKFNKTWEISDEQFDSMVSAWLCCFKYILQNELVDELYDDEMDVYLMNQTIDNTIDLLLETNHFNKMNQRLHDE